MSVKSRIFVPEGWTEDDAILVDLHSRTCRGGPPIICSPAMAKAAMAILDADHAEGKCYDWRPKSREVLP